MSHWIPRRRGTVRPPGPDQSFDSGYWFGGLQSLAAARAGHCPIGFRGAEGPGAVQVSVKALIAVIGLEGCSPLQPREPNTAPLDSVAPRDRAPWQVSIIHRTQPPVN